MAAFWIFMIFLLNAFALTVYAGCSGLGLTFEWRRRIERKALVRLIWTYYEHDHGELDVDGLVLAIEEESYHVSDI